MAGQGIAGGQPIAPTAGFNVNQAAAGALEQGMAATQQGLGFTPMGITAQTYDPARVGAGRINRYMNPYETQVVQQSMRDIGSAQEQALNLQGVQADRAKAFGGSRHGIAEAETRLGYGQQMADNSAQMRQQGFQTALGAAQADAATINAARQYAAQQRASAQAQNLAAQQAAMGTRLGAASQLAGLGQQHSAQGRRSSSSRCSRPHAARVAAALIDAARGQYAGIPAHRCRRSQRHWRRSVPRQTSQRQRSITKLGYSATFKRLAAWGRLAVRWIIVKQPETQPANTG